VVKEVCPQWWYSGSGAYTTALTSAVAAFNKVFIPYDADGYQIEGSTITSNTQVYSNAPVSFWTSSATVPISVSSKSNVRFENIIFDANSVTTKAVSVDGCSDIIFKNCTFNNGTTYGAYIRNSSNIILEDCEGTANGNAGLEEGGIYCLGLSDSKIMRSRLYDNAGSGLVIESSTTYPSTHNIISDNHFISNDCHGFLVDIGARSDLNDTEASDYRCKWFTITGNEARDNGRLSAGLGQCSGISIHFARSFTVTGNVCERNSEHGIVLMDGLSNIVNANSCNYNGLCGIRIQGNTGSAEDAHTGERYSTIRGNNLCNNGIDPNATVGIASGMWLQANCHDLDISGNFIKDSVGYGISFGTAAGYTSPFRIFLGGNHFYSNDTGDILQNYTDYTIYGKNYWDDVDSVYREFRYQYRTTHTADYTIPTSVSEREFNNAGATVPITFKLPSPTRDYYKFTFVNVVSDPNNAIIIDPDNASGKIVGLTNSLDDRIQATAQGDSVILECQGGQGWYVISVYGTWNDLD
jgi:parallel beta-helix repeat protein